MVNPAGFRAGPHSPAMDPHYRPFFAHVYALFWPWLWWNLVRLTAWRKRTGRAVLVYVDKYGNVYIRMVGDAPVRRVLPDWTARWAKADLAGGLPAGLMPEPLSVPSRAIRTVPDCFRTLTGLFGLLFGQVRAPP